MLGAIAGARAEWLFAGLGLALLVRALHAYQLAVAIRHHDLPLSTWRAFVVNSIAGFYSLFLPGQIASGAVKWYRLSKDSGRRAEVFAAVLFLRLVNSAFVLAFGVLAIVTDNSLGLGRLPWIGLTLAIGVALLIYLVYTNHVAALLVARPEGDADTRKGYLQRGWRKVIKAFRHYRLLSREQALKLAAVPICSQFLAALVFFAGARALDLRIPFVSLLWLVSLVYFLSLVPATISGLGLREGALVFLLPFYGVGRVEALAFSLVLFGFTLAVGLLGGLFEAHETLLAPLTERELGGGSRTAGAASDFTDT